MIRGINEYGKGTVVQIATVFLPAYYVICGRVFWSRIFHPIIESSFSETVLSKIHRLCGPSFFWKCSKSNVDSENEEKNWGKVFCFLDNSIWIGSVKLPVLRREYLSSAVNLSTNSPKIFHRTNLDFFQLNYVVSDQ